MSHEQIIRSWKDSIYRNDLNAEEQILLPANLASVLLTDAELENVVGQIALPLSLGIINNYYQYDSYTNSTNIFDSSSNVFQNNFYGD